MTTQNITWKNLLDDTHAYGKQFAPAFYKLNDKLGGALGQLAEQPQSIQGRDKEIAMLHAILERPKTPVALLLGQAGVGKTALVEEFAKQLNSGDYHTHTHYHYLLVNLHLGTLAALGTQTLQTRLSTLFDEIKELEDCARRATGNDYVRLVLFMDEVHMLVTIFGAGTKIGGDVVKAVLARSPIRIIAATTRREYDSTIMVDKPLSERFKQIEIEELPAHVVKDIARNWWSTVAPDCPQPAEDVLELLIEANAQYRSDSAEPRKSIDILEDLVSYCRREGKAANRKVVEDIFNQRYSISLRFEVEAQKVFDNINNNIFGQPHAMKVMELLVFSMIFQLHNTSNKPRATILFTGPTGVGKTETAKRLAEGMYPGQKVLLNINMPDYKTVEHEPAFRKRLGEAVRHKPHSVVLLDEVEKAHPAVLDTLLAVLDEGVVFYDVLNREGATETNYVSLRNTIIIATTNAGADVFANDARFSQRSITGKSLNEDVSDAEMDQLMGVLRPELQAQGFKPELLGRFSRIAAFRGLEEAALLRIAEREISRLQKEIKELKNIEIICEEPHQWPKDVYDYYTTDVALYITFVRAQSTDPNSGGARAIAREIDTLVMDEIVQALRRNPHAQKFKLEISHDSAIYDYGAGRTAGGVRVHALD
ncbi:AAA family ATPase [Corynebacterium mastitidis]|uniref:AAA family ATPase n=1 Tax=Corynebacterium mastitidis TaxID=161890 RepID=UPI00035DEA6B|nr:AAA family ATPase [Corynebacterium mastitidis]